MAGITGIGSGVDIDQIVKAMVGAERAPKDAQLKRLESATTSRISSLGTLKGALSEFQTALKSLNDLSLFDTRKATSSDTAKVTVSASKTALAGNYSMEVTTLASASKIASGSVAGTSAAAFTTGGKLTVSLGTDSYDIDVADGATLKEVRDSINTTLKDQGISANIVTDPVANTSRLVLSSNKTGAGKDLTLSADGAGLQALVTDMPAALSVAANAKFKIDGLELESATNSVSGVIEGVTFDLVKAEEGKSVTVTVGDNTSAVKDSLKKFVDSYNKLISTTNSLTSVVSVGEGKEPVTGGLVGDSSIRNLLSGIRTEIGSPANGELRALTDLGITTQKDGKLKIDDTKLDAALKENYDAVGAFVTGETGLMNRLDGRISGYVKSGGVLEQRVSGLQQTLSNVDEQKTALNTRVASIQARLYSQYNAMDSLVGQLSRTSDWLAGALSSLPGVAKRD
ncbi:flagellar filament capping protein FliD [Pseudomonas borbori]